MHTPLGQGVGMRGEMRRKGLISATNDNLKEL